MDLATSGRRRWTAALLIPVMMALVLAGCASNPVVDFNRPKESSHEDGAPLDTMEGARDYAQAYKDALNAKAKEYAGAQVQLDNALLGLGILTIGSLVAQTSKDVPLVLSGLFGATYLAGQQNLGKPRLEVYQSGVSATNCAIAAVAPLNFSTGELTKIEDQATDLGTTDIPNLAYWLALTRDIYSRSTITDSVRRNSIDGQLKGAAATYQAGLDLENDASQLPGRVSAAAVGLKGTVDVIAAQVDKLASNTIADPATVAKSVSSLAAIVGYPAPQAGLDTTYASRIGQAAEKAGAPAADANATLNAAGLAAGAPGNKLLGGPLVAPAAVPVEVTLTQALATLGKAQATVDATVKRIGGRIAASKAYGDGAATKLKDCGVSDAIVALTVDPGAISLDGGPSADTRKEFSAVGGLKPYIGSVAEPVPQGVQLRVPNPGDSTFYLTVPKDLAKDGDVSFVVNVRDNSGHTAKVNVTVNKPAPAAPNPAKPAPKKPAAAQPGK